MELPRQAVHQGTVSLTTERLTLRRFKHQDAAAAYKNWMSDPVVTTYLTWPPHKSLQSAQAIIDMWIENYAKADFYQWAICLKDSPEPIGSISTVDANDNVGMVQIGYCLGRAWQNSGLMSEALRRVIAFFFDDVGINRVESRHDPNNPASGKVMLKAGMTYEGTQRQADRSNQGIVDTSFYAIVAADYFGTQTANPT